MGVFGLKFFFSRIPKDQLKSPLMRTQPWVQDCKSNLHLRGQSTPHSWGNDPLLRGCSPIHSVGSLSFLCKSLFPKPQTCSPVHLLVDEAYVGNPRLTLADFLQVSQPRRHVLGISPSVLKIFWAFT